MENLKWKRGNFETDFQGVYKFSDYGAKISMQEGPFIEACPSVKVYTPVSKVKYSIVVLMQCITQNLSPKASDP